MTLSSVLTDCLDDILFASLCKDDKIDLTNDVFDSVYRKIGAHQIHLDISRCMRLTHETISSTISVGVSLMYLDISYTHVMDISLICSSCLAIRVLSLAGLNLVDSKYQSITALQSLEVLSLRSSNISDIKAISFLPLLRSLDLGSTSFSSVESLVNLGRLEELLLDDSRVTDACSDLSNMRVFKSMKSLQLINLMFSNIFTPSFVAKFEKEDTIVECFSRR
jgi:hypothetical protein